ncbi:S9 family peptidase [Salinarimonas sp.]|uniref:S9 family peptidase n=1 Tax=Salinarimonas sp. TaxID=2766526 RepID=UPI0032D98FD0
MSRFQKPAAAAPVAPVRPHVVSAHGREVRDDYSWIKAGNWREVLDDPGALPADVRAYIEAENAHGEAVMAGTTDLRRGLVEEMRGRMKEDDSSVPEPDGPFAYFTRYREGGEHPLVCRIPRDGGEEAILLDGDALSEGHGYFAFGDIAHTRDHARLAWCCDTEGSESYVVRIRELTSGVELEDRLEHVAGGLVWSADGRALYYVERDENHRPARVRRHLLGTPQEADVLVYAEQDPGWFVNLAETRSRDFGVIGLGDHETSEAWLLDLNDPEATPRLVAKRENQVRYDVEQRGDALIILTNADGAEDFKLVTAPLSEPSRANWRDLVPYRPGVMILSHAAFAGHLARLEREDAHPRIVLLDLATGEEHAIRFEEEAFSLAMRAGAEYDTTRLRFVYSSLTTPGETYDYDMASRERTLRKRQEVPSGHDPAAYVTRRLFATAPDGDRVPISLLARKDTPRDGSAPALLYGYGSYGIAMPASFRTNILSLVDRGFVFAIAHIRGGTEKGWAWYTGGKREKKVNTFQDFVACAETLIEEDYTRSGRIVAHGGSAGGMLMGAVANMAPDLFAGIVAEVPFVDVLNTMLDADLPLTPPEWPEWGNPIESAEAFDVILSYSPYDNVQPQAYPAILAMGGLTDPRVTYWEPTKWVARLRATMTGGGPVVLHMNMGAGHGGASGRFKHLEEVALGYAFALAAVAERG